MSEVTLNNEQDLYVIHEGKGYTCLGFDVCIKRTVALCNELGEPVNNLSRGSLDTYNEYLRIIEVAKQKHNATGWRSESELIPEFIGKEGERVEVVTSWGEKQRYYIGKSTGFIPCHLEIKLRNSSGGSCVTGHPFQSIKFLGKRK